jgi:hypothetical protein
MPSGAEMVEVTIVDRASGEPVAEAEVAWMDASTYSRVPATTRQKQSQYDPEQTARTYGWTGTSDSRGVVKMHLLEWTTAFARKGLRYGTTTFSKGVPAPTSGRRLEVEEDKTLLAKVLDSAGRPAVGVPIAIALHGADGAFLRLLTGSPIGSSSAPDGIARVPHLQLVQDRAYGNQALVPAAENRVRIHLPGWQDRGVAFDPKAPPAEPIVLQLPLTGGIKTRVELAGRPLPGVQGVGLYVGREDDHDAANRSWRSQIDDDDGWAHYQHVPVEGPVMLFTHLGSTKVHREVSGPRAPGEELTVVIEVPKVHVVLSGRLLDSDRQPVQAASLPVEFMANGSGGGAALATDAEGRFLFFLGALREKKGQLEYEGGCIQRFSVKWQIAGKPLMRAVITPRDLQAGIQDVGDLVLEPGTLVVGGRFMDGEQPYGKYVNFSVQRARIGSGREPRESWESVDGLTTNQDGKGTVRGPRRRPVRPLPALLPRL